jgi:hypothetical protein
MQEKFNTKATFITAEVFNFILWKGIESKWVIKEMFL